MSEQSQRKPKPVLKLKSNQEAVQQPEQQQTPVKKAVEAEIVCDNPLVAIAPVEHYSDILGYDDTHTKRKQARAGKHSRSNNKHEYSRKESRWN